DKRWIEIVVEAANLPATTVTEVIDRTIRIRRGAVITGVSIGANQEDFAGGTSIDIGTVDLDQTTSDDPDGIIAGATLADLNGGERSTGTEGAQVNASPFTSIKLLTWTPTGTFTDGVGVIHVFYTIPKVGDSVDTLLYTKP